MGIIPCAALPPLAGVRAGYPAVTPAGPRQSGKTTLTRLAFASKRHVSLDAPPPD
jgi:hypothetical protein